MLSWLSPPETWQLAAGEVHVWRASLNLPARRVQELRLTLTPDEQARADRFYFEEHRQRFIAGRGILRALLGGYLQVQPDLIRFAYSDHGKPALAVPGNSPLQFNVSHSADMALYAITEAGAIGVDIEQVRPVSDIRQMVERFFSPYEQAEWQRLPEAQQITGFFNGWTRKEAYIKARGLGLSLPLDQFDVSLTPGQPAKLLADRHGQNIANWFLTSLDPGPGYAGAVVVEAPACTLKCWHWPDTTQL
jgi:4'-phosphopantetheinyl transferase